MRVQQIIRIIILGICLAACLQECIAESQTTKPAVKIDANKTAEPISKYIYGQFIEHLGRCIYGGIWAEMLEDRKFYFPITPNYNPYRRRRGVPRDNPFAIVSASPWQIIGPADSVTMAKDGSFVGEHTPLIAPGGGIAQHDLALRKGKEYVGYVWIKPAAGKTTVRVSLRWGDKGVQSEGIACTGDRYVKSPLHFRAVSDTERATLQIEVIDRGACFVGTVSLMPADNIEGMRADTLKVLKELNAPMYRWPGGNFVSGYDWRDGIGDRDRSRAQRLRLQRICSLLPAARHRTAGNRQHWFWGCLLRGCSIRILQRLSRYTDGLFTGQKRRAGTL